jgi:hypothetical protein
MYAAPPFARLRLGHHKISLGPAVIPFGVLAALGIVAALALGWEGYIWTAVIALGFVTIPRRSFALSDVHVTRKKVWFGLDGVEFTPTTGAGRIAVWGLNTSSTCTYLERHGVTVEAQSAEG